MQIPNLHDALAAVLPSSSIPRELQSFIPGLTPLSTPRPVASAIATYLAVIFAGRELMRSRLPMKLTALFQLHNVLLTVGSGLLLALIAQEIFPGVASNGLFWGLCDERAWTPRLELYYLINYYFKYWELLDTVFLVLKKKPLQFLHVFHHSATAVLCYVQLEGKTSVSWVPIVLNLGVHVLMYYYYWRTAGGHKIWWKRYLTKLQITQFILDLLAVVFVTYTHLAHLYFRSLPGAAQDCAGTTFSQLMGCALLGSYLVLFVAFFRKTYKKGVPAGRAIGQAAEKTAIASGAGAGTLNVKAR